MLEHAAGGSPNATSAQLDEVVDALKRMGIHPQRDLLVGNVETVDVGIVIEDGEGADKTTKKVSRKRSDARALCGGGGKGASAWQVQLAHAPCMPAHFFMRACCFIQAGSSAIAFIACSIPAFPRPCSDTRQGL
jgi:hypothetical protein